MEAEGQQKALVNNFLNLIRPQRGWVDGWVGGCRRESCQGLQQGELDPEIQAAGRISGSS